MLIAGISVMVGCSQQEAEKAARPATQQEWVEPSDPVVELNPPAHLTPPEIREPRGGAFEPPTTLLPGNDRMPEPGERLTLQPPDLTAPGSNPSDSAPPNESVGLAPPSQSGPGADLETGAAGPTAIPRPLDSQFPFPDPTAAFPNAASVESAGGLPKTTSSRLDPNIGAGVAAKRSVPFNPLRDGGGDLSPLRASVTAAPRVARSLPPIEVPSDAASETANDAASDSAVPASDAADEGAFSVPVPLSTPGAAGGEIEPAAASHLPPPPEITPPSAAALPPAPSDSAAEARLPVPETDSNPDYQTVQLFYGTDRAAVGTGGDNPLLLTRSLVPAAAATGIAVFILVGSFAFPRFRRIAVITGLACLVVAAALATGAVLKTAPHPEIAKARRLYGNQRGELEVGICEVSIPRTHKVGIVESPSILRLELEAVPEKHVMVQSVQNVEQAEFFRRLQGKLQETRSKDVLVFVHGYNTTFDNAARRTAQITHDLKFDGATVFFSWPSQGGVLQYTVDETNVAWAVPHLKQFLLDLSRHSGAESVNLIAHSMGNRALTAALRELKYDLAEQTELFRHVVLAAPDIDAEIFRRDIAPALAATSRHVTLYASSDDRALVASKQVHGYPRAGDSSPELVVTAGVETIDVSGIDTSLLGHSYYGSNLAILADLYDLIHETRLGPDRTWLEPIAQGGLTYYRMRPELARKALPVLR